jgi:hypothetical protein
MQCRYIEERTTTCAVLFPITLAAYLGQQCYSSTRCCLYLLSDPSNKSLDMPFLEFRFQL